MEWARARCIERLPPDLADMAIGEFPNLLDSGFQREAVAIFMGPDWRIGDRLLPRLKDVAFEFRICWQ
jgi:hypothetical protein